MYKKKIKPKVWYKVPNNDKNGIYLLWCFIQKLGTYPQPLGVFTLLKEPSNLCSVKSFFFYGNPFYNYTGTIWKIFVNIQIDNRYSILLVNKINISNMKLVL